ncbi:MAG: hypothetical protein G01um101433_959 [Parcubacteria group bacterium Gr01-1014_33]|nr:MAG: hypothetical protein G01um101433_959 [Parcubacteria group bacterium Gr01-1014_33]
MATQCMRCKRNCPAIYHNCIGCGLRNECFDEYVFEERTQMSLFEAQEDCRNNHITYREVLMEDPELFIKTPYCPDCGEKLFPFYSPD